jgi:hypothetical protein
MQRIVEHGPVAWLSLLAGCAALVLGIVCAARSRRPGAGELVFVAVFATVTMIPFCTGVLGWWTARRAGRMVLEHLRTPAPADFARVDADALEALLLGVGAGLPALLLLVWVAVRRLSAADSRPPGRHDG